MKYQIEVPSGIWTNKTVVTPLGNGRYLTVKLAQSSMQTPIVIELAELRSHRVNFKNYLPVPFSDIEFTYHRDRIEAKPIIPLN